MSSIYKLGRRTVLVGLIVAFIFIAVLSSAHSQDPHVSKIESDDPAVVRAGTWSGQTASQASGGSYLYNAPSRINGDDVALTLQFSGPSVEILYVSGPNLGTMAIEIDGVVLRTVITTNSQTAYQQSATIDYLTDEAHTLRVYAQAGGVIGVDAFNMTGLALPSYSVQVPIQRSARVASPDCATPTRVRRLVLGYDGSDLDGTFLELSVSNDGLYVVFSSNASRLIKDLVLQNYYSNSIGIYRVNTQTCVVELVSPQDSAGRVVSTFDYAVSDDGRYIAFATELALTPNDTDALSDVYVRDMVTGTITFISPTPNTGVVDFWASQPEMSSNGRFVLFRHQDDNNSPTVLYIMDRQTGQLAQVPVIPQVSTPTSYARIYDYSVSDDGRYVAYDILTLNDWNTASYNAHGDLYLTDRQTGVSVHLASSLPSVTTLTNLWLQRVSADGRFIVYSTNREQIVPNDVGPYYDMFVYDRITNIHHRLTIAAGGGDINGDSWGVASSDARYLCFTSSGTNVITPDLNGEIRDVFLLDRNSGVTTRISEAFDGTAINDHADCQGIASNGRFIAFTSFAYNIVPNDSPGRSFPPPPVSMDLFFVDLQGPRYHTALTATASNFRQVSLTWTQYAPTPTLFEIQRSLDGVAWTPIGTTTTTGQTSYVDTTVSFSTTYYYRLRVLTLDPNYMDVTLASRVRTVDISLHSDLQASTPGGRRVDLTWTQYAPTPTQFEVQRSPDGLNNWTVVATTSLGQTTYTDSTVDLSSRYYYRLRALTPDPDYLEYSTVASITTSAPLAHTQLSAVLVGPRHVDLTWEQYAPTSTQFEVQRSLAPNGNWVVLGTTTPGATTFADTTTYTLCSRVYFYRLRVLTVNLDYEEYSNSAQLQTPPCPPDTLALINPTTRQISLINTLADPVPSGAITTFTSNARASGQWVMGDWDGDGNETPGVYEASGAFMYTNELGPTASWRGVWFGLFGHPPVVGHFDSNIEHDCVGVVDSAYFAAYDQLGFALYYACDLTGSTMPPLGVQWLGLLLQHDSSIQGDFQFAAGDFDTDGIDTIAVRRGVYVAWTNTPPSTPSASTQGAQYWGATLTSSDYGLFVAGSWNNDGADSFGFMFQNGDFAWRDDLIWNNGGLTNTLHTGLPVGTPVQAASWR